MKSIKYLLALLMVGGMFAACDTDIENVEIQKPYTYSPQYYQNLRDYKASDHSIAFMWFAQYGAQNSMAVRFAGIPDSCDIVSLWGGIPSDEETDIWEELRFCQQVKGTKMLVVSICRIDAESDDYEGKEFYEEGRANNDDSLINKGIDMYADHFIDMVFENDLDGFDADYEPEGDYLEGDRFVRFMNRIALYMGPNPNQTKEERLKLIQERYGTDCTDVNKMLCVDAPSSPPSDIIPICNYYFKQAYGGGTREGVWPIEKTVFCCNVGDNWKTSLSEMYKQASYQPETGRKGGFGAFFGHRDYTIHENEPEPYARFRECIQIQNPAVH